MGLDSLLAELEARAVTPVTATVRQNITAKPLQTKSCTVVTSVTDKNTKTNSSAWGATDWQAFFDERASVAEYDGRLFHVDAKRMAYESCITHWMNKNPSVHTDHNTCPQCHQPISTNSIPVLTGNGGHLWLHDTCHTLWLARRRQEAMMALKDIGISIIQQ